MMDAPDITRGDRLSIDIDTRLSGHWTSWLEPGTPLAEADGLIRDMAGAVVRVAYAQGYIDALQEDRNGRRSELHRTHGYRPE